MSSINLAGASAAAAKYQSSKTPTRHAGPKLTAQLRNALNARKAVFTSGAAVDYVARHRGADEYEGKHRGEASDTAGTAGFVGKHSAGLNDYTGKHRTPEAAVGASEGRSSGTKFGPTGYTGKRRQGAAEATPAPYVGKRSTGVVVKDNDNLYVGKHSVDAPYVGKRRK